MFTERQSDARSGRVWHRRCATWRVGASNRRRTSTPRSRRRSTSCAVWRREQRRRCCPTTTSNCSTRCGRRVSFAAKSSTSATRQRTPPRSRSSRAGDSRPTTARPVRRHRPARRRPVALAVVLSDLRAGAG